MAPVVVILIALQLQAFGYATTCTQGDSGSALAGSILSMPLLFFAAMLLFKRYSTGTGWRIGLLLSALVLVTMMAVTRDIWINTLIFGTPCGDDFQFYGLSGGEWWLIVSAYLLFPAVILGLCLGLGVRSLKREAK